MEWVYDIDGIQTAAEQFWDRVQGAQAVAFSGNMGAGKTTFIQALCKTLGVSSTVSSPTFSIINEYRSDIGAIYHIDLYRCKDEEEAVRAGVEECLYSGSLCLVEWPSRAPNLFPPGTVQAAIGEIDERTRKLSAET